MTCRCLLVALLLLLPRPGSVAGLAVASEEIVTTAPVAEDGVLYAASYEVPEMNGHLRAFALHGSRRECLWDAAELVPPPGSAVPPPVAPGMAALAPGFHDDSGERLIVTNLPAAQDVGLLTFDVRAAHLLQPLLGVATVAEAGSLINAVRGRLETSAALPGGTGDRPARLGAISRSSPALVGGSAFDSAAFRDQVLYAGAEDGLLHAILAGRWSSADTGYDPLAAGCGRELWAYLPGSLLPALATAGFDGAPRLTSVHVDGAPAVDDLFYDSDGDGRCEWHTVLVGTASVQPANHGVVFALDVTDPYAPRLLWERNLGVVGLGPSRGVAIGRAGTGVNGAVQVYVTAAQATGSAAGRPGVIACALDLVDGTLRWRFVAPYPEAVDDPGVPPTAPVLMEATGSGGIDGILFGDLAGRLWALAPENGAPMNDGPIWLTPGGAAEPLGGGLALSNRLVLFGTGGVESAPEDGRYAVYAVEILPAGARLLWTHPLERGEKLWGAPTLDRFGRAYFGVGDVGAETGRLVAVAADGTFGGAVSLAGVPCGGPRVTTGAVVTISRGGTIEQVGELRQEGRDLDGNPLRVRVFSWRMR